MNKLYAKFYFHSHTIAQISSPPFNSQKSPIMDPNIVDLLSDSEVSKSIDKYLS